LVKGNLDAVNDVEHFDFKFFKEKVVILKNIPNLIISTGDSIPYKTPLESINQVVSYFHD